MRIIIVPLLRAMNISFYPDARHAFLKCRTDLYNTMQHNTIRYTTEARSNFERVVGQTLQF